MSANAGPDTWSVQSLLGHETFSRPDASPTLFAAARAVLDVDFWQNLRKVCRSTCLFDKASTPHSRWCVRLQLLVLESASINVNSDLFEFARFLICCVLTDGGSSVLSPSSRIDHVWHAAMLFNAEFAALGRRMNGGSEIRHFPLRKFEGASARSERLARTRLQYFRLFGKSPPADIWDEDDERSAAESMVPPRPSPPAVDSTAAASKITEAMSPPSEFSHYVLHLA